MNIVTILGAALGSAWTSGINLYATVAVLGLIQRMGWAQLPGGLDVLASWPIIGIAAFFYVIEFVADKVPYVDSVWDVIHTFVRVPAGAVLALAATTDLPAGVQVAALLLGGGVALTSHGTKASLRAAANLSPEPVSNWTLSLAEDVLAVGGAVLTALLPLVILVVVGLFLIVFLWLAPKVFRRFRRVWRWFRSFVAPEPAS